MRVAIPLFGSRVSPRCVISREVLLADLENGKLRSRRSAPFAVRDDEDVLERLVAHHVDLLVCGGISGELREALAANGVEVIHNVAGEISEVLEVLERGELRPGHGLEPSRVAPPRPGNRRIGSGIRVDCIACESRACVRDRSCDRDLGGWAKPWLRGEDARAFEIGRDISAESDPKLCRIAELVHFAVGMGYRRIGLAFCWELFHEVETLVSVLSRFFEVVPVCCRIGARAEGGSGGKEPPSCNPVAQARILAEADTDLNVLAGLCMGCDILFTSRSHAPVTTLFVKDRALAHNPVGAIYTRYHLEDLAREGPGPSPRRPVREELR